MNAYLDRLKTDLYADTDKSMEPKLQHLHQTLNSMPPGMAITALGHELSKRLGRFIFEPHRNKPSDTGTVKLDIPALFEFMLFMADSSVGFTEMVRILEVARVKKPGQAPLKAPDLYELFNIPKPV
jgi:hypothetical protein